MRCEGAPLSELSLNCTLDGLPVTSACSKTEHCVTDTSAHCCPSGFDGPECRGNIDECADKPCQHSGECIDEVDGFSCRCPAAWRGELCDACGDGYTGDQCEVTEQCLVDNVCTGAYACVEEPAPKAYRCAGQFPERPLAEPANRFTVRAGVVSDGKTGHEWQQTVDPSPYTWAQAKAYCAGWSLSGGGWRLPTRMELLSIVDATRINPAIDPSAFPSTPPQLFWSSSPYVGSSDSAWTVPFAGGGSYYGEDARNAHRVRCVR